MSSCCWFLVAGFWFQVSGFMLLKFQVFGAEWVAWELRIGFSRRARSFFRGGRSGFIFRDQCQLLIGLNCKLRIEAAEGPLAGRLAEFLDAPLIVIARRLKWQTSRLLCSRSRRGNLLNWMIQLQFILKCELWNGCCLWSDLCSTI